MKMIDDAMQATQPQGPPPEQIKAEAAMKQLEMKGQMDAMKFQADMRLKSADLQLKQMDIEQKQLDPARLRGHRARFKAQSSLARITPWWRRRPPAGRQSIRAR